MCHVFFKHNKDERAAKSICGYLGHSRTAHERSRVRDTEHNVQSENTEGSLNSCNHRGSLPNATFGSRKNSH